MCILRFFTSFRKMSDIVVDRPQMLVYMSGIQIWLPSPELMFCIMFNYGKVPRTLATSTLYSSPLCVFQKKSEILIALYLQS